LIHCFKIQSSVISCNYCWFYLIVDLWIYIDGSDYIVLFFQA
jgi:hypothetical protein